MTEELVLVPLWQRPGMAWACLDRLAEADAKDGGPIHYRLLVDHDYDRKITIPIDMFRERIDRDRVEITYRGKHPLRGNSVNLITGYAAAILGNWSLVHMVEEDVLVADGYFDYHRQAHALAPDAFAVSACRNQNHPAPLGADQVDSVWTHPSYQSLGISFRPAVLEQVVPHSNHKYFDNPVAYCKKMFPASRIPAAHAEQDGLLNRIREKSGESTVYPCVPRAYHAGFGGYNRNGIGYLTGTPEEQGRKLLAMSSDDLNALADYRFRDFEVVPLSGTAHPVTRLI